MSSAVTHELYWENGKLHYSIDYSPCVACREADIGDAQLATGYLVRPYCDKCKHGSMLKCGVIPGSTRCAGECGMPDSVVLQIAQINSEIPEYEEWEIDMDPDKFGLEMDRYYSEEEVIDILNQHNIPNPRARWEGI